MEQFPARWCRATLLVAVGLALAAGSVACSGGTKSSTDYSVSDGAGKAQTGAAAQAPPAAAPGLDQKNGAGANAQAAPGANAQAAPGANAQAPPGAQAGKPGQVGSLQRSIIYTGSITVRVDSVDAAATRLETLATAAGGFVGEDRRRIDAGRSTATLVLRVPAEKFGGILDDISSRLNGREQSREVSTEDVTATVIDLDARIRSQQASVDRVRALLGQAQSLTDITSIESQLTQREADLESMQARKRSLDDLTTLSTVTVELLGPEAVASAPKADDDGFWGGLKGGWRAFSAALRLLLTVLGAVLPFAVVLGVALWLVIWQRRRRSAPAPVVSAPGVPATPAEPAPNQPAVPATRAAEPAEIQPAVPATRAAEPAEIQPASTRLAADGPESPR